MGDSYAPTASFYELITGDVRRAARPHVRELVRSAHVGDGPVLDVGAGSGPHLDVLLDERPDVRILALEPSAAMRSLLLQRVGERGHWWDRITVRPETLEEAVRADLLPGRLAGALALGVLGHLDDEGRSTMFAALGPRLRGGGLLVIDLQLPARPTRVAPFATAGPTIGGLSYEVRGSAEPEDGDAMRWELTYRTTDGTGAVVDEASTSHVYHHPPVQRVLDELAAAGLRGDLVEGTPFVLARAA